MNNNIFISTGGFKEPGSEIIKRLYNQGIKGVELSGGKYSDDNIKEINNLKKKINIRLHNYFPPPKIPFVLNVASSNNKILDKTMKHIFNSIDISSKIKSKYYSFHAGFLLDPQVDKLGKKFDLLKLQKRDECLKNFKKNVIKISEYAKYKNILILIENNVLTIKNLKLFKENPFLLSNPSEICNFFDNAPNNVKLLMDVGHLKVSSVTENFSKVKALKDVSRFIDCYHLSENNGITDSNKPFNKKAWFLNHLKKNLDYYTIEVYTKSINKLKNQYSILREFV